MTHMEQRFIHIGNCFRLGLPRMPFLNGNVVIRTVQSCQCRLVARYGLLEKDFPSSVCDCDFNDGVTGLDFTFPRTLNRAYLDYGFYFSFKWFAVYTPVMLRDFLLACVFESNITYADLSHGSCSNCHRDSRNLFGGYCFDCRILLGFNKQHESFEDYLDGVVCTLCDLDFLSEDFVRKYYRDNLFDYLTNLFDGKRFKKKVVEPFFRDPYVKPLGCPDGEDPLKFVVEKIVAEGKQCRLYGDYAHYNAHLSSVGDVLILDSDVESGRGRVLKYDYEELRRKVLTRP